MRSTICESPWPTLTNVWHLHNEKNPNVTAELPVETWVWERRDKPGSEFLPLWTGPMVILAKPSPMIYLVQHTVTPRPCSKDSPET